MNKIKKSDKKLNVLLKKTEDWLKRAKNPKANCPMCSGGVKYLIHPLRLKGGKDV